MPYLARDLVSRGRGSYVALVDHEAGKFEDDLEAGLWLPVANGAAGGINPQGTYDPAVTYAKGAAVLVTYDGGVTYVQTAARVDLPAGTALDHADDQGNPSWVTLSLRQRTAELVYRGDPDPRHVGSPLSIPKGMAGSGGRLDNGPINGLTMAFFAQGAAPGSALRPLGTLVWAAGQTVATRSGSGGVLAAGDTVTVTANGSTRPFVLGLSMTIVGVPV